MGRGGHPSQNWPSWDQSLHFQIRPRRISDLIENSKIRPCKTSPPQYQILVQRDENFSYSVCLELDFKEIFERDFVISLIHRLLFIAKNINFQVPESAKIVTDHYQPPRTAPS